MEFKQLKQVRVQNIEMILEGLVEQFKDPMDEVPAQQEITVSIASQSWTGFPINMENIKQQIWLVMCLRDQGVDDALLYLPVQSIVAIKVHNVVDAIPTFFAANLQAPTKTILNLGAIEIKKMAVQVAEDLKKCGWPPGAIHINWGALEGNSYAGNTVFKIIRALVPVFEKLLDDPIGKEALLCVKRISINAQDGEELECDCLDAHLSINVGKNLIHPRMNQILYDRVQAVL